MFEIVNLESERRCGCFRARNAIVGIVKLARGEMPLDVEMSRETYTVMFLQIIQGSFVASQDIEDEDKLMSRLERK